MYYFRDSYFDQQIAYGIARSVQIRRFGQRSPRRRTFDSVAQVVASLVFLVVTFTATCMLLDVMGYQNLTTFYAGERLAAALGMEGTMHLSL